MAQVLQSAWTRKAHPAWTRDDVLRLTKQQLARALDSIRKYKSAAAATPKKPLQLRPPCQAGLAATDQRGGGGLEEGGRSPAGGPAGRRQRPASHPDPGLVRP